MLIVDLVCWYWLWI